MTITQRIKKRSFKDRVTPDTYVFLGLGYVAKAMIETLPKKTRIYGTSRNPDNWSDSLKERVKGISFKGLISAELKDALLKADYVICSIPPNSDGDLFLRSLCELETDLTQIMPRLKWMAYLSATSVYGDRQGGWAHEDDFLRPINARGRHRIMAELDWLETGVKYGWPVHIFRLAGIYGGTYFEQSRNPFIRIKTGKARAIIKEGHVVNRIHAGDIVRALKASILNPNTGQVYNVADGHPSPPQDVLDFAADLIGAERPKRYDWKEADISDMARSFYRETKRIDISRARDELGFSPLYSDYKKGLSDIFKSGCH